MMFFDRPKFLGKVLSMAGVHFDLAVDFTDEKPYFKAKKSTPCLCISFGLPVDDDPLDHFRKFYDFINSHGYFFTMNIRLVEHLRYLNIKIWLK